MIFFLLKKSDIRKFADDNTLFSCGDNLSVILKSLEHDISIYDSSEISTVKILSYNWAN